MLSRGGGTCCLLLDLVTLPSSALLDSLKVPVLGDLPLSVTPPTTSSSSSSQAALEIVLTKDGLGKKR